MYSYGQIECLNHEQTKLAVNKIDKLCQYWIPRGTHDQQNIHFHTLGVTSYIDASRDYESYIDGCEYFNPILMESFDWMYNIIIQKITEHFGPAELFNQISIPGFHIFGQKKNKQLDISSFTCSDKYPCTSLHVDYPQYEHGLWKHFFKDIEWTNPLTCTLALELPHNGGGLYTWANPDITETNINNYINNRTCVLDSNNNVQKLVPPVRTMDGNMQIILRYLRHAGLYEPMFMPYIIGNIAYSFGFPVHQICEGVNIKDSDRRITLQLHGLKCDGIWRLFF